MDTPQEASEVSVWRCTCAVSGSLVVAVWVVGERQPAARASVTGWRMRAQEVL